MRVELIENMEDLIVNIETLRTYLKSKHDPEYSYAIGLIKRGTCFVKYKDGFYPSRFIGYKNNTMDKHEDNEYKDGRVTNPQIGLLLGKNKPEPDANLDKEYCDFCEVLGFTAREKGAFGVERKYWIV